MDFTLCALQAFGKMDMETGEAQLWHAGPRSFCGELVFAPSKRHEHSPSKNLNGKGRNGAQHAESHPEEAGYLLGIVYDSERDRSSLVVSFQATSLAHFQITFTDCYSAVKHYRKPQNHSCQRHIKEYNCVSVIVLPVTLLQHFLCLKAGI